MSESEKNHMREMLREMLGLVPASVRDGGIQKVRAFKDWHARASKKLDSSRITMLELQSLYNEALSIYK